MSDPASVVTTETKRINRMPLRLRRGEGLLWRILLAVFLSMLCAGVLVAISGHNPVAAFAAMVNGALGSPHQIGVVLNRTTLICSLASVWRCVSVLGSSISALKARSRSGELARRQWRFPGQTKCLRLPLLLRLWAAHRRAAWAAVATAIHLGRRVHEVLTTLLLNFVALLLVQQLLAGPLGQFGAGFLHSPLLPREAWLLRIPPGTPMSGFAIALVVALFSRSYCGARGLAFAVRVAGHSRPAARYAGFSLPTPYLERYATGWRARGVGRRN